MWLTSTDQHGRRVWRQQGSAYAVTRAERDCYLITELATGDHFTFRTTLTAAKAAAVFMATGEYSDLHV